MYPSTLRLSTFCLFSLLTLSSALPAPGQEYSSDLLVRDGPGPQNPDGHVPDSYVSKVKLRSEETLNPVYQLPRGEARDTLSSQDRRNANVQVQELSFRDELDIATLESRKAGAAVEVVSLVIDIVKGIKSQINADNLARGAFTQETVAQGREKSPHFNWVVCHTKHEKTFSGKEGTDWGHRHEEVDIKIGGTIGYEIYWFKQGTFKRKGDGGYLNWAYSGFVKEVKDKGATVVFNAPP